MHKFFLHKKTGPCDRFFMHSRKFRFSIVQLRQLQDERGAFALCTFTNDAPAMPFYHGFDHAQAKPKTVTALGGIETPVLTEQLR